MAIEVKHGANPSALIYSRFAGAEGKAARGAMDKFLQASQRQQLQRRDQDFRAYEMAENQGFRLYQQDREHVQQMQRLGAVQRGRSRDRARYQQDRRELIDYKFTAEQRDRQNRIRQALSTLDYDESLSPEDREEAKRELMYQWSGMQAPPSKEDPSPYAPGQGVGEYWYDEKYGGWLTRDEGKGVREFKGQGLTQAEAWKMAIAANTGEEGVDVDKARAMVQELTGGQGGGPGGPGGAGGVAGLNAPSTEEDQKIQEIQGSIERLDTAPVELEVEKRVYGNVKTQMDPDEVENIPMAEAQIETQRARLEKHLKEKPADYRSASEKIAGRVGGLGRSQVSDRHEKWKAKEKALLKSIDEHEKNLESLMKKRDLLDIHLDVMSLRNDANRIAQ